MNVTVNADIVEYLDNKCKKLGLTRSALVSQIVSDYKRTEEYIIDSMPEVLKGIEDIKQTLTRMGYESDVTSLEGSVNGVTEPSKH